MTEEEKKLADEVSDEEDTEIPAEEKEESKDQEDQAEVEQKEEPQSFDWESDDNPYKRQSELTEKRRRDVEDWSNRLSQRLAELERKIQPPPPNPEQEFEKFAKDPQRYIAEQTLGVFSLISPQIEDATFKANYPDWQKYQNSMDEVEAEMTMKNPAFANIYGKREIVYELAKAREIQKGLKDAQSNAYDLGKRTQQDKEKIKTKTELSTAGSTKPNVSSDEEWIKRINKAQSKEELDKLAEEMGKGVEIYNQPRTTIM